MSTATRRRSMTRKAQQRLEAAQRKMAEEAGDLVDIEEQMTRDLEEIVDEWRNRAEDVETVEIGLEKTDIGVDEITLVWIPQR